MDLVSVFCRLLTSFPSSFVEEAVFSPPYIFSAFVKDKFVIVVWLLILVLYSVPLVFMSVFVGMLFLIWSFRGMINMYWGKKLRHLIRVGFRVEVSKTPC
jgi:hypothetical protein